jgi:AcrR family transcriptional regulator
MPRPQHTPAPPRPRLTPAPPRPRLTPAAVAEAGAALADEVGFDRLSMGLLAERLGVRTPSLYKHVAGQADLAHRIAVLAMTEVVDALREATQGRSGSEALTAGAQAMRLYVREHPGRHAAANVARATGPDDPLIPAAGRVLASWAAMLRGYHLEPGEEIHALRMLRSALHGFATLEMTDGFPIAAPVDDSFTWMIATIDHALRATLAARPARAG